MPLSFLSLGWMPLSGELNHILIFGVVLLIFKVVNLFLSRPYQFSGQVSLGIRALVCVSSRHGNPIPPKVQGMNDYECDLKIEDLRTVELLQRQLEQQQNDAQP